jgi:hypothetical protein
VDELVGEPRGEGLGDEFVGDSVREGHSRIVTADLISE